MRSLFALLVLLWPGDNSAIGQSRLANKTLKVVTILNNPFVMRDTVGYKGYYIDMLNLLSRELKFKYEIYEVTDGQYGKLEDGKWSGMIGDVVSKRADVTLATLRITGSRMQAVDFTVPVSASGMSILIKKPESVKQASTAALVLKPFAPSTWILLLFLYLIYTAIAFAIWLLSPYELNQRCLRDAAIITKAKKAGCGAWLFVTGGLFLQGFARTPKAPSARILAFAWWLFVLISISCYIANLVPILMQLRTRDELKLPISNLQDLVQQTTVSYGVIKDGATQKMLEESNLPEFQAASAYLSKNPQNSVNTPAQAVDKVRGGGYAWIAEGVTAEYYAMNFCELASVPTGLSSLDFGLAVAKGSELKAQLDEAILKIKTSGELASLRGRWWTPAGGPCDESGDQKARGAADSLQPGDLVVLYVLLLVGGLAALTALPVELRIRTGPGTAAGSGNQADAADQTSAAPGKVEPSGAGVAASGERSTKEAKDDSLPESRPLV